MKNSDYGGIKSRLIKASGGKLTGADVDRIRGGDLNSLSCILSPEEKRLLLRALSDKSTANRILSDPAVKDILNGGKK